MKKNSRFKPLQIGTLSAWLLLGCGNNMSGVAGGGGGSGTNSNGGIALSADQTFTDSAPSVGALSIDTGAPQIAASRDEIQPAVQLLQASSLADYLKYTLAANGKQDGPITVSVTEQQIAKQLMTQVNAVLKIIEQATGQNPTTKNNTTHVWILTENNSAGIPIDYKFTENKGKIGFGWNLEVKKHADPDSDYVKAMAGRLKRDKSLTDRSKGSGFLSVDFSKYNSVVGGAAQGQAMASFKHSKIGVYHLYKMVGFSPDGSTPATPSGYLHSLRIYGDKNGPVPVDRVFLRGGGLFDVFTPVAGTDAGLENINYRLHRFVGVGGYGHARASNVTANGVYTSGDINGTGISGGSNTDFRVIRECWDKDEKTFVRYTWECTDDELSKDCQLEQTVPTAPSTAPDNNPYGDVTHDSLVAMCFGSAGQDALSIAQNLRIEARTEFQNLLKESPSTANDSASADTSASTSVNASAPAPEDAVPSSFNATDSSGDN